MVFSLMTDSYLMLCVAMRRRWRRGWQLGQWNTAVSCAPAGHSCASMRDCTTMTRSPWLRRLMQMSSLMVKDKGNIAS